MDSSALITDVAVLSDLIADRLMSDAEPDGAIDPHWPVAASRTPSPSGVDLIDQAVSQLSGDLSGYADPLRAPAIELLTAVRHGTLSAAELTRLTLARIAETEPALHSTVLVREGVSLDASSGALAGLPLAVKDIFDVAGLPTRCGSVSRQEAPDARSDATAVARLRAAGATIVSKTVTQEFAAGVISPPARNPWDPTRIPGGSSGGSGVAVAVGAAALALGTDTGGSIRIPAAICGVAGLKPTFGGIDRAGVFPLSWSLDTVGPLARTVRDVSMAWLLLRDHHLPTDPGWRSVLTDSGATPTLEGMRLGVSRPFFHDRLMDDVRASFAEAVERCRSLGAEIIESPWPDADLARAAAVVMNRAESAVIHASTVEESPDGYGAELKDRLIASRTISSVVYLRARQAAWQARRSMAGVFARYRLNALLAPTTASAAVPADDLIVHYADGVNEPVGNAWLRLNQPFNATGQPVVCVPVGLGAAGLPIGLQIAGAPGEEVTICRIAAAFEAITQFNDHMPTILRR